MDYSSPEYKAQKREEIVALLDSFNPQEHFFNERTATMPVTSESPQHLQMIQLKVAGNTNLEIAAITGYTPCHVGQVLRQPWAKKRLLDILSKDTESLQELMQAEALASIQTLAEIRDDVNAPASARVTSAINLADRFFGKPTQRVETFDGGKAPSLKDVEALDSEIAKTQEELKQLESSR